MKEEKKKFCANCKFQKNKPSKCFKFVKEGKFTPRKDICTEWKSK